MKFEPYMTAAQLDPIDRWCRRFVLVALPLVVLFLLAGCAGMDTREHEELHCAGFTHQDVPESGAPFRYEWVRTRPASVKPWQYLSVPDVDFACRMTGADPARRLARINGCAVWKPKGCTIYLQAP